MNYIVVLICGINRKNRRSVLEYRYLGDITSFEASKKPVINSRCTKPLRGSFSARLFSFQNTYHTQSITMIQI